MLLKMKKTRQKPQEGITMENKTPFGTKEWASRNENLIKGCGHDCKYCYAKSMAIQYQKKTSDSWKIEVIRDPE